MNDKKIPILTKNDAALIVCALSLWLAFAIGNAKKDVKYNQVADLLAKRTDSLQQARAENDALRMTENKCNENESANEETPEMQAKRLKLCMEYLAHTK